MDYIEEQKQNILYFLNKDCGAWDYLASNFYSLDNEVLYQLVMELMYVIVNNKLNNEVVNALKEFEEWEELKNDKE